MQLKNMIQENALNQMMNVFREAFILLMIYVTIIGLLILKIKLVIIYLMKLLMNSIYAMQKKIIFLIINVIMMVVLKNQN